MCDLSSNERDIEDLVNIQKNEYDISSNSNMNTLYNRTHVKEGYIKDVSKIDIENIIHTLYDLVDNNPEITESEFRKQYSKILKKNKANFLNKATIIKYYNEMVSQNKIDSSDHFMIFLQKKHVRNISGVLVITVMLSPYPNGQSFSCEYDCYYCPNEPGQPRSYLADEMTNKRANQHDFDLIGQMTNRLKSLQINGHTIDKLEIIVQGGTHDSYPDSYLNEFYRDMYYVANTYFNKTYRKPYSLQKELDIHTYRIKDKYTVKIAHIIGLCIETRPDTINTSRIEQYRKWGVTRIQLGVQHSNNKILKKINRGHTIEHAIECMEFLKDNGFKIDIHVMPDLPNSNEEEDIKMIDFMYSVLKPDQMKLYPCEVVPYTTIKKWHESGKYKPYAQSDPDGFIRMMKHALVHCPEWLRLSRVVRDIPTTYITGGNLIPNLRQILDKQLDEDGDYSMDIRNREIGRNPTYKNYEGIYNITNYNTTNGKEYFISYQSTDGKALHGFTRLRIPNNGDNIVFPSLIGMGLIRELHVYGNTNSVGQRKDGRVQHKGIGSGLIKLAENIALQDKCVGVCIISGEGVKTYYSKKLGYYELDSYMVKYFHIYNNPKYFNIFTYTFIFYIFIFLTFILISNII